MSETGGVSALDSMSGVGGVSAPSGGSAAGTAWDDLVAGALLGTERRPYRPPTLAGDLMAVVQGSGDLLGAAGALWAYREAGRLPESGPLASPRAAAPADGRPWLPDGTLRSLAAIVTETRLRPLFGEWLQLAAADGRRLAPEWIPALLDLVTDEQRPQLEEAAGPRCTWLAAQRPEWAAGGVSTRAWQLARSVLAVSGPGGGLQWDGADDDRVDAFDLVRRTYPDAARRLAESVWTAEPPATRAALVARFAHGLSQDDEPFLEQRLDERRKDVRLAAAGLLARLPASRYAARMGARARSGVRMSGGEGATLRVEPPVEVDPEARRDGITAAAAAPDQWLLQVVGAAPLDGWIDPDGLVAATGTLGARAGGLLAAWSLAAERQNDSAWARRLLAAGAAPAPGLLRLLPAEEAECCLLAWLAGIPLARALDVLTGLPGPWSPAVTDAVMNALAALVTTGDHSASSAAVRDALPRFALAAAPGQAGSVAAVAAAVEALPQDRRPAARAFWGRALTSLNALVHFRQAMQQEFRPR